MKLLHRKLDQVRVAQGDKKPSGLILKQMVENDSCTLALVFSCDPGAFKKRFIGKRFQVHGILLFGKSSYTHFFEASQRLTTRRLRGETRKISKFKNASNRDELCAD